jgi:flagellar biosynthesis protein FlhG
LADSLRDQADGLRRMFRRAPPPIIAFVGARNGSGATRVTCAYARELAARGLSVCLIDEHRDGGGAAAMLGAHARFDLWQVINGDALITQAMVLAGRGLSILPAARLAQQREALDAAQQARLEQCWRVVCEGCDVVVIDARLGHGGRLSALSGHAEDVVLVSATDSAAVMGAYLVLKQIVLGSPRLRLSLLINRALDGTQAAAIADNLRGLLQGQLGRRLECTGWLPRLPAWRRGNVMPEFVPGSLAGLETLFELLPDALRIDPANVDVVSKTLPAGQPPTSVAVA